jgi:hypothetical protein
VFRRFWLLVPGGALAALNLVERETGKAIAMPVWAFWGVFGVGILVAAFLAFHDLRAATAPDTMLEVRRRIGDEIDQIISEGEGMVRELGESGLTLDEFGGRASDWWNSAYIFIEAVLGKAECQIISEPLSGSNFPDLITSHCNLLRGSLGRLANADLRVDQAALDEAIEARRSETENA